MDPTNGRVALVVSSVIPAALSVALRVESRSNRCAAGHVATQSFFFAGIADAEAENRIPRNWDST